MKFFGARVPRALTMLCVLAAATGFAGSSEAQVTEVRFASVGGITDAPLYLAEEYGLFAKEGLKVELRRINNAPNLMTAVATNQLEAAGISVTPGLFAAISQDMNLRIVGDKQSLQPGISATRLVIRSDLAQANEAENMKVLKGKTIAVSAKASSVYMLLQRLLKKHGMTFEDVKIVELAYPNMLPALTTKAIDAAINLEPFMSQALQAGAAKVVSDLTEFVPPSGATIVPIVYSEKFAENKKAATAFMKAYLQGVRMYTDAFIKGKDKEKVVEIVARHAKIDPKVVRDGLPAGFDTDQNVSVPFLADLQTFFVEQNFLRASIDVNKLVDSSFAKAAVAEVGPYK